MFLASEAEFAIVQWPGWVSWLAFGLPTLIAATVIVIVLLRERRRRSRP